MEKGDYLVVANTSSLMEFMCTDTDVRKVLRTHGAKNVAINITYRITTERTCLIIFSVTFRITVKISVIIIFLIRIFLCHVFIFKVFHFMNKKRASSSWKYAITT